MTEGTRGLGFYLATIDQKVTANALDEMRASRIYLVVEGRLKDALPHYKSAPNVITFEHFFRFQLDPALERWKEAGII